MEVIDLEQNVVSFDNRHCRREKRNATRFRMLWNINVGRISDPKALPQMDESANSLDEAKVFLIVDTNNGS